MSDLTTDAHVYRFENQCKSTPPVADKLPNPAAVQVERDSEVLQGKKCP